MKSYKFSQCSLGLLEDTFGLNMLTDSTLLNDWLAGNTEITPFETEILSFYQQKLRFHLYSWNEQELAMNFIGPILSLVGYSSKKYNLFSERRMSAKLPSLDGQDIELSGDPDGVIASGFRVPKIPYFCFHEYKPEADTSGDAAGQALAAMVVGQALNDANMPIYGCYVVGQNWYFMLLQGKDYVIATPFAATSTEIFDVFRVLKVLKYKIELIVGKV
jgi:hypothetical protein